MGERKASSLLKKGERKTSSLLKKGKRNRRAGEALMMRVI
jgi:hypothetical protein